jgi:hypothetical protein
VATMTRSASLGLPGPGRGGTTTGGGNEGTVVDVVVEMVVEVVVDGALAVVEGDPTSVDATVEPGTVEPGTVGPVVAGTVGATMVVVPAAVVTETIVVGLAVVLDAGVVVAVVEPGVVDDATLVVPGEVVEVLPGTSVVLLDGAIVVDTAEVVDVLPAPRVVLVDEVVVEDVVDEVVVVTATASAAESSKRSWVAPITATSSPPRNREIKVAYTERKSTDITMFLRLSRAVNDGC